MYVLYAHTHKVLLCVFLSHFIATIMNHYETNRTLSVARECNGLQNKLITQN